MPKSKAATVTATATVTVDEFKIRLLTAAEIKAVEEATRPEHGGRDALDEYLEICGL